MSHLLDAVELKLISELKTTLHLNIEKNINTIYCKTMNKSIALIV